MAYKDKEKEKQKDRRFRLRHPEKIKAKNKRQYGERKQLSLLDETFGQHERVRKQKNNGKYRNSDNGLVVQQAWVAKKTEKDPDYFSRKHAKWSYRNVHGMTLDQYEDMFVAQDGKCAICGQPQKHKRQKRLHIDHDHKTKKIRKLLCYRCNVGVGYFGDNPAMLRVAAAYIEAHQPLPMLFG